MRNKAFSQNINETRYCEIKNKFECIVYGFVCGCERILMFHAIGSGWNVTGVKSMNSNSRQCQNTIRLTTKEWLCGTYCCCKHKNTRQAGPQPIKHHKHHQPTQQTHTIKTPNTPTPTSIPPTCIRGTHIWLVISIATWIRQLVS